MRQLYYTIELIGIKDKNITLTKVFQDETHIEMQAILDYTPPKCSHCQGKQINTTFKNHLKFLLLRLVTFLVLFAWKREDFNAKTFIQGRFLRHLLFKKTV